MKKVIFFLLTIVALSSCVGIGPQGPAGKDGFVNFKVIDLQVNQSEWKYSDVPNNNYFIAKFSIPELTRFVYNNGVVQVYREYNTGTEVPVQVLLPQVRHKEYEVTSGTWGFYTETVDYEYGIGALSVVYTASDFDYELDTKFVPETMHFRAVLMW